MSSLAKTTAATLAILIGVCAQALFAEDTSKLLSQAQPAAVKSLDTLRHLVNGKNYKRLGFHNLDEVRAANLGKPLQVFKVRLDDLKKYEARIDPGTLLSEGETFIYPVTSESQVRSSVTIAKSGGRWNTVAFGNPESMKAIVAAREKADRENHSPMSQFLVQVPALNISFVGYRAGEKLMLIPLADDARFDFKADVPVPAAEVFSKLASAARDHPGLPS